MSDPAPAKTCFFCGESCAGQPRAKDPKGRYYHIACAEAAKRAQQERLEQQRRQALEDTPQLDDLALDPLDSGSGAGGAGGVDLGLDAMDDTAAAAPDRAPEVIDDAPAPAVVMHPCPQCGGGMPADAVVCVSCGYDARTGGRAKVMVGKTGGKAAWPVVIGVISLLVALGSIGFVGLEFAGSTMLSSGAHTTGALVGLAIRGILALYLLLGAVQMLTRNQNCLRTLRTWAIIKIVLALVCGGAAVAVLAFAASAMEQDLAEAGVGDQVGVILAITCTLLLASLSWPIFLLVWLRRDAVQEEVGSW